MEQKKRTIIIDIDGTLTTELNRDPFDYAKCENDNPRMATIELLQDLRRVTYIILLTGREDAFREQTIRWLMKHDVPFDYLFMRRTGDRRQDAIMKKECYKCNIEEVFDVWFVLEDRDQAVKMWREELKLPCWQVDYGKF